MIPVAVHVFRHPVFAGGTRRFHRGRFGIAVAFEVVAANFAAILLGRAGLIGYIWPAIGIVVALHFIGLWWASGDGHFITLTLTMLAVNVVALFFPGGGAAMLAVCGLGSAACRATALLRR